MGPRRASRRPSWAVGPPFIIGYGIPSLEAVRAHLGAYSFRHRIRGGITPAFPARVRNLALFFYFSVRLGDPRPVLFLGSFSRGLWAPGGVGLRRCLGPEHRTQFVPIRDLGTQQLFTVLHVQAREYPPFRIGKRRFGNFPPSSSQRDHFLLSIYTLIHQISERQSA